ncbi:alpha/beta fold hydrolase [Streptomyces canus]|uniref:thioesterase II family protein n=1 Tax=Streptomyces canus TaxID=58343 RepID=UPI002E28CCF2|nr:alpha/beta fold hydrolase [Streptomyces canus]
MTAHPDASVWLQCTTPRADAGRRLVCFPHAGGSASFYRDWGPRLPAFEVHAVRYPGRAERIAEPAPADLRQLGRDIADALVPLADLPLVLFGHSMGAVVALETARHLEQLGVSPAHLFASGSRNAPLPVPEPFDEDADAVCARLVALGGTDAEMAADPVFQELVLPYIMSDGRMFTTYDHRPEPVLRCPVTTIVGDRDADADCRPWPALTDGTFMEEVVHGDHFYLVDEPPYPLLTAAEVAPARRG